MFLMTSKAEGQDTVPLTVPAEIIDGEQKLNLSGEEAALARLRHFVVCDGGNMVPKPLIQSWNFDHRTSLSISF